MTDLQKYNEKLQALAKINPELAKLATQSTRSFMENVREEDITHPRILLLQGMSDLVKDGKGRPGQVAFSKDGYILCEDLRKEGLVIVPIFYWFSRIKMKPIAEGGWSCQSKNGRVGQGNPGGKCDYCEFSKWTDGPNGKRVPPPCRETHNFIVYLPNEPEKNHRLAVLAFHRSSIKAGKDLINHLSSLTGPSYMYEFKLGGQQENNEYRNWIWTLEDWEDTGRRDRSVLDREDYATLLSHFMQQEKIFKEDYHRGSFQVDFRSDDEGGQAGDDLADFERTDFDGVTIDVDVDSAFEADLTPGDDANVPF